MITFSFFSFFLCVFLVTWSMIATRQVMFPRATLAASREDEADDPWIKLQQNNAYLIIN